MAVLVFDTPLQTWTWIGQAETSIFRVIWIWTRWTRTWIIISWVAWAAGGGVASFFVSDFALNANIITFFMTASMTSLTVSMTSMVTSIFVMISVSIMWWTWWRVVVVVGATMSMAIATATWILMSARWSTFAFRLDLEQKFKEIRYVEEYLNGGKRLSLVFFLEEDVLNGNLVQMSIFSKEYLKKIPSILYLGDWMTKIKRFQLG